MSDIRNIKLDMNGANLTGSPICFGDGNVIVTGDENMANTPFDQLEDDLISALSKFERNSKEYKALKEALHMAQKKDKNGFAKTVKNNRSIFIADIVKNALGSLSASIIMKLINFG